MVQTNADKTEADLRKFMLGIENSSDAIFITDTNGIIEYINASFEKIYGFTKAEALGKTPRILKSGHITHKANKHLWSELLAGGQVKDEIKNKTRDGRIIDIESSNNPIVDDSGAIVGFLSINRDITEKKMALVELTIAKEKAEESDRLKSAFLDNISHEIRTPLNAITGFSALLSMGENDPESQSMYIESILKSSDHLLSIVSDIIDISSIQAKTTSIQITRVNLNSRINSLFKQFLPQASDKNLSLFYNSALQADRSDLMTDPSKFVRIFSNLISNAIKFTLKGQITFGYDLKDPYVEFFVSDTGIGIPIELHAKIFENFYQAERSLNRQFEGTGLGLPICKAFTESLGGKIWLQSEPGKGSTFFFTLPFIQPVPDVDSVIKIDVSERKLSPDQKKILVAEDDDNNFILINVFLSYLNANVIHAKNGIKAVELCRSEKNIDLILMDINMPEMDGYTATMKIREFLPDIKIIAQTAFTDDVVAVLKSGCSDFLSKPFTREQLILKVNENLKKQ